MCVPRRLARAFATGNIMRECRDPATPCHRVIGAGGALGGYGGNLQLKRVERVVRTEVAQPQTIDIHYTFRRIGMIR